MNRALALAAVALTLSAGACSTSSAKPGTDPSSTGPVRVVASTDVYGDIAKAVGGSAVEVTSIIDDPDKDPHEYEADAKTQLALSKAQVVIRNGAGYDDFVTTMLKAAPRQPALVNVADASGYDPEPADGEFNEHLWYDFPTVVRVADALAADLGAAAPASAATFAANATAFKTQVAALEKTEADIKAKHAGEGVAITEPVPLYLLTASGLQNKTPAAFSEAIEEDTDVPPAVLQATLRQLDDHEVRLLVYNQQTTGPQTEAVLAAAEKNGVPVVGVTETLPAGETYLSWMQHNLAAVSQALSR